MKVFAVLIDTVSIQNYVFGSNRLKENLGASYLIGDVYETPLKDVMKEILPESADVFEKWREKPDDLLINTHPFEIGYIGGGNALLLFQKREIAEKFIREWTTRLLLKAPGVATAVALNEFDCEQFSDSLKKLFLILQDNKSRYHPQTVIPRHGITAECTRSNLSMEIWCDEIPENGAYISSVTNAKIKAAKENERYFNTLFRGNLCESYCFTDEFEQLGSTPGENSHIAVVHIDGNGMGKRFQKLNDLPSLRRLSISVHKATHRAFETLLTALGESLPQLINNEEINIVKENGLNKFPLRPIILGGDDITFVTDGRLGVYCADIFIREFEKQTVSDEQPLSACGGIAVIGTKFPFHRGYELSESLCRNAKKTRKRENDIGSWIDFHLAYGGFSGSLESIRNTHYKSIRGSLLMRPYKIGKKDDRGLDTLLDNSAILKFGASKEDKGLPNLKIKELREVLTQGEGAAESFVQQLQYRNYALPKLDGKNYHLNLFEHSKTPYFDMIEILELYPECILRERRGSTV
ncbi:MAG: hypothetical protein AB2L14_22475 [Candidatus Xenobiia bacterium LiM19]